MTQEWEIAVIGAGPAGLSAAIAAAQSGVQVVALDAYPVPGGQVYKQPPGYLKPSTLHQRQGLALWEQAKQAGVTILSGAQVWYADASKRIFYQSPEGNAEAHAQALILATGAYERPLAFPGWTLPGVMMTGGAQTLLYQHILPGKRVLLVGTGPLQLVVAKKLLDAGAEVVAVLEGNRPVGKAFRHLPALWGQWERLEEGAASYLTMLRHGVPYRTGWGILEAQGTDQVEGAVITRLDADWRAVPDSTVQVRCDTICTGYGFLPFNALSRQMGAEQEWNEALGGIIPRRDANLQTSLPGIYAAGDCAGIGGVRMSLVEGRIAGYAAAASLGHRISAGALEKARRAQKQEQSFQRLLVDLFTPGPGAYELATDDTLLCRCEGVTTKAFLEAVKIGAQSSVELKSDTRIGMGECQGRFCEQNMLHALAQAGRGPIKPENGYHLRPPVFPVPIGILGDLPVE